MFVLYLGIKFHFPYVSVWVISSPSKWAPAWLSCRTFCEICYLQARHSYCPDNLVPCVISGPWIKLR